MEKEQLQELAKQSADQHFNAKHEGDWYAHYYGFIYGFQKAKEIPVPPSEDKTATPVIEQKRKSAFEIIKWKIGKIINEKFLKSNDGKFHTAVELNPAIHAVAEFCEQYAESKQLTPSIEKLFEMVEKTITEGNYDSKTGENLENLSNYLRRFMPLPKPPKQ